MLFRKALLAIGLLIAQAKSLEITVEDDESVKRSAADTAFGLMTMYTGNNTGDVPGNLPKPYFWWVCGAMFGTLIDYWHYTGDDSYNEVVTQGLMHQTGENSDFDPANQTMDSGNDDQGFWAMTALTAAEHVFPDPPEDKPQWLALAQGVYNQYKRRWDTKFCNGGLRWQILPIKQGWDYKNTISNGCFFNVAARLARYTGEDEFQEWAEKLWDWMEDTGLIKEDFRVFDGVHIVEESYCNFDKPVKTEWSYNSGILLQGAAVMYNHTGDDKWRKRVDGLVDYGLSHFVKEETIIEAYCEEHDGCNVDQSTFKGYYVRWLAATITLVPDLHDRIFPIIQSTARAAAQACSGTSDLFHGHQGQACGFRWLPAQFDGQVGIGEQMNALSAFMYLLVDKVKPPATGDNGGTSSGDPNAGSVSDDDKRKIFRDITVADRVGAGILTTLILAGLIAGCLFVTREGGIKDGSW